MSTPREVHVAIIGGDPLGGEDRPTLSWWLPETSTVQHAYRIRTSDGYDTGVVVSQDQSFVPLAQTRTRTATARVQVRTDVGESEWSEPVALGDLGVADGWAADWIGVEEPARPAKGQRPAYWLRTTFEAGDVTGGLLRVTCHGMAEVFLNGVRVGEDELLPGYTQYRQRVQAYSYDVSQTLRRGSNVVAVLLADGWFRGQVGMPRAADQFGEDLALLLQVDVPVADGWRPLLASDPTWRTAASHVLAADLIGGQHEDRRLVDPAVHDPDFDDGSWARCPLRRVTTHVAMAVGPPVRRVAQIEPVSLLPRGDGAVIVDLGQNINGWLRVLDLGPEGTRLSIRHGEHLAADGDLTTAHLDVDVPIFPEPLPVGQVDQVVSAGVHGDVFEPRLTTHGFRYARIEGHPGGLTAGTVRGVVVHSDLRRTGWFSCSDERLNRLHEAVVWSLRGNACSVPTDCPQRERSGWTGDWQIFAPTAAFLFDVLGFTRSWLRDVRLDQRADGCVAGISPSTPVEGFDGPVASLNGSAGWGDVVVSAPWDLYQAYGDGALLRECWPAATAWVDYAAARAAAGRHPSRIGRSATPAAHERYLWDTGFHWGEWLEPGLDLGDFGAFAASDKAEVATAYLVRSATTLARIGEVIGARQATVEHYRALAAGARAAWQAEFLEEAGTLRTRTQAAHVRALAFDLVPTECRELVAHDLQTLVESTDGHVGTGFLSTGLLLPTLAEAGLLDTAYQVLLQETEPSWLTMLDRGATTVWERWDGVDASGVAHESLNHYSKGAVVSFLHRYVAGLSPRLPGYRAFRVQPAPGGGLSSAHLRLDSPFGPIVVDWRTGTTGLELDLEVPPGTTAEVRLPERGPTTAGPGLHHWPAS